MKEYTAKVTLRVKAHAYTEEDVRDLLSDLFSPGEQFDVLIEKSEVNYVAEEG